MSDKFTPGPWEAFPTTSRTKSPPVGVLSGGRNIRVANIGQRGMSLGELNANARLIAAAPDLLEACKAMLSASRTCGYDCEQRKVMDAQKMAEAAIAKAESPANDAGEGEEK